MLAWEACSDQGSSRVRKSLHASNNGDDKLRRRLDTVLASLAMSRKFPFLKLLPSTCENLSERLEVTIFYGPTGTPVRYRVKKVNGTSDGLSGSDTLISITFPAPDMGFRHFLTPREPNERFSLGRYVCSWMKGKPLLMIYDDMTFLITTTEALALDRLIFGSADPIWTGETHGRD